MKRDSPSITDISYVTDISHFHGWIQAAVKSASFGEFSLIWPDKDVAQAVFPALPFQPALWVGEELTWDEWFVLWPLARSSDRRNQLVSATEGLHTWACPR